MDYEGKVKKDAREGDIRFGKFKNSLLWNQCLVLKFQIPINEVTIEYLVLF